MLRADTIDVRSDTTAWDVCACRRTGDPHAPIQLSTCETPTFITPTSPSCSTETSTVADSVLTAIFTPAP